MVLRMAALRKLSNEEKQVYLQPYSDIERRKVVRFGPGPATFEPKGGQKSEFAKVMDKNAAGLVDRNFPTLLLSAKNVLAWQKRLCVLP